MKGKNYFLLGLALLGTLGASAQQVFEKRVFQANANATGDVELKDVIYGAGTDTTDIITTGFHIYKQDSIDANLRAVLVSHDEDNALNYAYNYVASDSFSNEYNTSAYSVVKYASGYIMVGRLADNTYEGTSVPGGGDLLLLKCDRYGGVVASRRIDLGGNDNAYAIKAINGSTTDFILCGNSGQSVNVGKGFVMRIDHNLNIVWNTKLDFRKPSGLSCATQFYDVTTNGTNIWAVGIVKDSASLNTDGVVVKLQMNGSYLTSRNVYKSTDREVFNHVEMDGANLIITGKTRVTFIRTSDMMIGLQYNTTSNTVTKVVRFNSAAPTTHSTGRDILKTTAGGSTSYYVLGESLNNTTPHSAILYKLNSSFQPIAKREYKHSGSVHPTAMTVFNGGGSSQSNLSLTGTIQSAKWEGYVVHTDLNGYSGCSDSVAVDTSSLLLSVDTLMWTLDTNYTVYFPIISRDSIVDSLICGDTISIVKNGTVGTNELLNEQHDITIYPNPVRQGENIYVNYSGEAAINQIVIYDQFGRQVARYGAQSLKKMNQVSTSEMAAGIYIVKVNFGEGDMNMRTKEFKVIIQ